MNDKTITQDVIGRAILDSFIRSACEFDTTGYLNDERLITLDVDWLRQRVSEIMSATPDIHSEAVGVASEPADTNRIPELEAKLAIAVEYLTSIKLNSVDNWSVDDATEALNKIRKIGE